MIGGSQLRGRIARHLRRPRSSRAGPECQQQRDRQPRGERRAPTRLAIARRAAGAVASEAGARCTSGLTAGRQRRYVADQQAGNEWRLRQAALVAGGARLVAGCRVSGWPPCAGGVGSRRAGDRRRAAKTAAMRRRSARGGGLRGGRGRRRGGSGAQRLAGGAGACGRAGRLRRGLACRPSCCPASTCPAPRRRGARCRAVDRTENATGSMRQRRSGGVRPSPVAARRRR